MGRKAADNRQTGPAPAALPARDGSAFLADPLAGLTDAEVRRLKRSDLLEVLVAQGDEIARLRAENVELSRSVTASQDGSRQLSELVDLVLNLDSRQQEQGAMLRDILRSTQGEPSALPAPASPETAAVSTKPTHPSQSKASASGLARKLFSAASHINS